MLLSAVVGSGIMSESLSGGNAALTLLGNSVATGGVLLGAILTFRPISGAHFNPVITLSEAVLGTRPWREAQGYIAAQTAGAFFGVALANRMFELPVFFQSQHSRAGRGMLLSEMVATFGLLMVVQGSARMGTTTVSLAVAAYVTAAYWYTMSTGFANPAVTLARAATGTFSCIRLADVPAFAITQLAGGTIATVLFKWLVPGGGRYSAERDDAE
jgi:glycerol uptake facilitator-like aquaporin